MAGQEFHKSKGSHTLFHLRPGNCSFAKAIEAGPSWPECLDVDDTFILRQTHLEGNNRKGVNALMHDQSTDEV